MNPFEFILAVMILMFAFTVVRHKMGIQVGSRRHRYDAPTQSPQVEAENVRLRQQVEQLQERMKVLERIVTDRGAQTAAQIEALRDREQIENGDKVQ
jgi:cell division protein FtsB